MGETLVFLATFLLIISLRVQAQAQEELSKEGIVCITQNREKSALDRWLHCLHTVSSKATQEDEGNPFQIITESALGRSTHDQKAEQFTENKDVLAEQSNFSVYSEEIKANSHLGNDVNQIKTLRSSGEDALLSWLKFNLALFVLVRLLFGPVRKCVLKVVDKELPEPSMNCSTDDNMEDVPEVRKSVIVNDMPSKNYSGTANLEMLGRSLGSAVGAVFSEVLLKLCTSGSSILSDKICVILESALKELSAQVEEDDCCSRLIGDFITSFKSTYTTMYRIHQACAYGESKVTHSNDDYLIRKSNCDEEFMNAKSSVGITSTHTTNHPEGDTWKVEEVGIINTQARDLPEDDARKVKEGSSLYDTSTNRKQRTLKSTSVLTVDALPKLPKFASSSAALQGEPDSGAAATSTCNYYGLDSSMNTETHGIPGNAGSGDSVKETLVCGGVEVTDEIVTHLDYEVDDASSVCEDSPSLLQSNALGPFDASTLVGLSSGTHPSEFQKVFLNFYKRHVRAQEQLNQFKFVKLQHIIKQQNLEEEKIQLASAANGLMRENIDLGRSRAHFKENRALEQHAKAAHMSFCTTCTDELAAGLCVMLTTLVYSVRMYSIALLNDLVSMCQPGAKEPRRSVGFHIDWFYNSLDSLAGKLQAIVCHFTVTGRILIGSILVGVVAQALLRRSVTNSSQAMPATILIIVLGGVCGFVGKVSVDSLGGSGIRWWIVWGSFCLLHALINCFTPSVYRLLHGSPTAPKSRFGLPFWIRRLAFHSTLVLFLPLLAGLLPFGTLPHVMRDLYLTLIENFAGVFAMLSEWAVISLRK